MIVIMSVTTPDAGAKDELHEKAKSITNHIDLGEVDKALAEAQELARQNPKNSMAQTMLGKALVFKGRYNEAAIVLRKSIRLDNNNAGAHWYLGQALAGIGANEESKKEYMLAVKLRPKMVKNNGCGDCDWMKHLTGH